MKNAWTMHSDQTDRVPTLSGREIRHLVSLRVDQTESTSADQRADIVRTWRARQSEVEYAGGDPLGHMR